MGSRDRLFESLNVPVSRSIRKRWWSPLRAFVPVATALVILSTGMPVAQAIDSQRQGVQATPSPSGPQEKSASAQADVSQVTVATIVLPVTGWAITSVLSKSALNSLSYALTSPTSVSVCTNCVGGEKATLGRFDKSTELVFSLADQCGTFLSTNTTHARISELGNGQWQIAWEDGGASCSPDGDFNDLITEVSVAPSVPDAQTLGCTGGTYAVDPTLCAAEPVDTATGSYFNTITDLSLPGIGLPFAFTRTYNSADPTDGPLGVGWTHSYNAALTAQPNGDEVFRAGDGQQLAFVLQPDGTFQPAPGGLSSLVRNPNGTFTLTRKDQVKLDFDAAGVLTVMSDRNGNELSFVHEGGQLSQITDSAGRVITLGYNPVGRLTSVSLPDGRSVSYGYTGGQLTSVTDVRGFPTTYAYDGGGRLDKIVDANLHTVVHNVYDASGRVQVQEDGFGYPSRYSYDQASGITTLTDARGNDWRYFYRDNVLIKQVDPLGNETSFGSDAGVNTISVIDPRGNTWRMTYDARGNLLTKTAPAPLFYQESFTYNARNDITSYTDGRGNPSTYDYDAAGNLIRVTQPLTTLTEFGRDPNGTGLLTSLKDPRGKTTLFDYDASGNMVKITSPLGNMTTMTYDPFGRMKSWVDPRGNVAGANPDDFRWSLTYNEANQVKTVTDPLGNQTTWDYDPVGNVASRKDANNRTAFYTYDADNRLNAVKAPDQTTTSYTYDRNGNLETRTDANIHTTNYTYDKANRLASTSSPTNQLWTYSYDPAGNLAQVVTALGNATPTAGDGTITSTYDALNRLKTIDYSDTTPDVTLFYDANGNREAMTDGPNSATYIYDALNRLKTVSRGAPTIASFVYDAAGNVTSRNYPNVGGASYTYDDDGRMTKASSGSANTTYAYDAAGNVTTTVGGWSSTPATTETRTYDRAGRLTRVENVRRDSSGTFPVSSFAYTYDAVGNPTKVVTSTGTVTYAYDTLDRLIDTCFQASCTRARDPFIRYTYDPAGNRKTEARPTGTTTYTYNASDQLTSQSGANGNLSFSYDQNGNEIAAGAKTFTYDLANRLTSAKVGNTTTTYTYDGDGNRLRASTGTAPSSIVNYLWDPNASIPLLAGETDGNNALLRKYAYGLDLFNLVAADGDFTSLYLYDGLGSVVNLVNSFNGNLEWTYSYEPFGTIRTEKKNNNRAPTNRMRFTGEYFDTGTGLYHLRARQYDPGIGRFLAQDPIASPITEPDDASYVYVNNRPTVLVDPTGMFCLIGSNPDGSCRGGGVVSAIGGAMSEVGEVVNDATGLAIGAVAVLRGGRPRQCGPAICIEGSSVVPPWASAVTVGHTIIAKRELDPCQEVHELTHVAGYEDNGFYVQLYLWESAFGGWQEDNLLEYDAYRAEATCRLELRLEQLQQAK